MAYKALDKYTAEQFEDPIHRRMEFLRSQIFKDCSHAGVISTHHELCGEIVDRLGDLNGKDVLIWLNPEFLFLIRDRFPTAKIWFVTGSVTATCMDVFDQFGTNITVMMVDPYNFDSVKTQVKGINMKFDVVVGNPPYQSPGTSGKKLWKEFFKKFFDLTKDDGLISIITPSSYIKRQGVKMKDIRSLAEAGTTIYINMDATSYFDVGEDICAAIFSRKKLSSMTTVIYGGGIVEQQDLTKSFSPTFGIEDTIKKDIVKKILDFGKTLQFAEDINNSQAAWVKDGRLSEIENSLYKYPVIYTPNTTHYSKNLFGDKDALRLMVTIAGTYYSPESPNRNVFISRAHSGQGMLHILINSEDEGQNIKSYMVSRLYRWYIETEKTSGYNTGLKNLPDLGRDKKMTDDEVFDALNLTAEERRYVNSWFEE